jgi:hypothetical protein
MDNKTKQNHTSHQYIEVMTVIVDICFHSIYVYTSIYIYIYIYTSAITAGGAFSAYPLLVNLVSRPPDNDDDDDVYLDKNNKRGVLKKLSSTCET